MGVISKIRKKYRGIALKYIRNVVVVSFVIVVAAVIGVSVFLKNYFYDNVALVLKTETDDAKISVMRSNIRTQDEFVIAAKLFAESYDKKGIAQARLFTADGKEIVSSGGIVYNSDTPQDVKNVIVKTSEASSFTGNNSSGEKIMSYTSSLRNVSGEIIGIINISTSLEQVDNQIFALCSTLAAAGLAILLLVLLTGQYFVTSIIRPIVSVSKTARRIAQGDFSVRLKSSQNDEIGDLCESINYMAAELGQTEKMKSNFISSISHELRTPLTAIKGWAETIKATDDPEINKKGLDIISGETMRLSRLVEELLDFSHLQKDEFNINLERVDITAELSDAAYIYEHHAKQAGVEFVYSEPDFEAFVIGDADRLKQVFINIIDNAVKYSEKGGRVAVSAERLEKTIKIKISDTGCGIPAAELENVKRKFYKVNQRVKGSGIGLAVADELISRHNGSLSIESVEGEGTTVTIVLPLDMSGNYQQGYRK